MNKLNIKKVIILISIIVVLLILGIILIINGGKKKQVFELGGGSAIKYVNATFKVKSYENNILTYTLTVKPTMEQFDTYEDVKITYSINLLVMQMRGNREIKQSIRIDVPEIKLKEDGTFKGTFTYDLGENQYTSMTDEYKVTVRSSSGTVK